MIVRENIQRFRRGIDAKQSLGLGKEALIKKWFEEFAPYDKYEIDDDLNIRVERSLDLSNINMTSLPDNLSVGWSLDLRDTNISSLPDNLSVGGYLDLSDTDITSLPDNLTVGSYLDLRNTKISSLPDDLRAGGGIFKDF